MNKKNGYYFLITILFIALIIRLIGINKFFFADEAGWASITEHIIYNFFTFLPGYGIFPHPPIGPLIYIIFSSIFGDSTWVFRLVPIIFGMGSIILTYLIAKKIYNEKIALISAAIMTFSFWHVLASLQVDIDGSILTFFIIAYFYCLISYESDNNKKWMYLSAIFLGLAFLTKYPSIFLPVTTLIYFLIKTRDVKKTFKFLFPIFTLGFLIFLIYPIYSFIVNPDIFMASIKWGLTNSVHTIKFRVLFYLIFWTTPLLIAPFIWSFFESDKRDKLLKIFVIVAIIGYIFFLGATKGPFERYLMIIIPFISILTAKLLSEIKFNKKNLIIGSLFFILSFSVLLIINFSEVRYLKHDTGLYINEAINLKWDFNFPYTGSSGPEFWINFLSSWIIVLSGLAFLLFIFFKIIKNSKLATYALIIFFSLSLSFNLFLINEYLFSTTHPDMDVVNKEILNFNIKEKYNTSISVSYFQQGLSYYLDNSTYGSMLFFSDENFNKINKTILKNDSTVLMVEFPGIDKNSISWLYLEKNCNLSKIFKFKNKEMAYLFYCDKNP